MLQTLNRKGNLPNLFIDEGISGLFKQLSPIAVMIID